MKKWLPYTGAIAVVIFCCFFFFIPFRVSRIVSGRCLLSAADRCFTDTSRWADWWPKTSGMSYRITGVTYNQVRISLGLADGNQVAGTFTIAPLSPDSILFRWDCRSAGIGFRKELGNRMEAVLDSFRTFIQSSRNIYGVNFHQTMSHDSTLVVLVSDDTTYPATGEVYKKIDSLEGYIASQHAAATGLPWLNVTHLRDGRYRVTVAMPTDRRLDGIGRIVPQRYVPWKQIEGDVYGGPHAIEQAFQKMLLFKYDHVLTIIAQPYQYLIIDRRQQPDTSKWVTRVCAPTT